MNRAHWEVVRVGEDWEGGDWEEEDLGAGDLNKTE